MEELVIAVRVTAENAEEELQAISGALREIGAAGEAGVQRVGRQMAQLRSQLGLTGEAVQAIARDVQAAARAAEMMGEDVYGFVSAWIAHRKHMGDITAQEEIAALSHVREAYAVTAAQIMQIDERIHDARESLRSAEADKLTTLHAAVESALAARCSEQQAQEEARLEASIAAWRAWSEDTCAAIRKQIDALDAQAEAEERAKTQEEHLRKIAGLEQALAYETDAYNRGQLLRQIGQAQEAWAQVQAGWAADDQRAALEAQIVDAQARAEAEIGALEKEGERIGLVYSQMLNGQNLAAQAQKLLMQSSQEELLSLLAAYAPDYEATGRSLGEKIYAGFQSAFGDITAWFAQLDAQFEQLAEQTQQAAFGTSSGLNAAGQGRAGAGVAISQTVNFNQPVESAADVTRRMQRVSEELAAMV